MTEKDWVRFFDLIDKIVTMGGSWQEKRDEILRQADTYGARTHLEEIANWVSSD